jgi:hypothetical protein
VKKNRAVFGAIGLTVSLLAVAWLMGACAPRVKTVTNLPAGVTQQQAQQWDSAVATLHKIASTTSTLRKTVIQLHDQGIFPDSPAYAETLRIIANADVLELNAANFLKKTPSEFGLTQKQFISAQMQAMIGELNQINSEGLLGIKNSAAQKQVSGLLTELTAAAQLILAL